MMLTNHMLAAKLLRAVDLAALSRDELHAQLVRLATTFELLGELRGEPYTLARVCRTVLNDPDFFHHLQQQRASRHRKAVLRAKLCALLLR